MVFVEVVVSYSPHEGMYAKFKAVNMQIAGGVPFKLDEDTKCGVDARKQCFRIGLFGLDKLRNIPTAVSSFEAGLNSILSKMQEDILILSLLYYNHKALINPILLYFLLYYFR